MNATLMAKAGVLFTPMALIVPKLLMENPSMPTGASQRRESHENDLHKPASPVEKRRSNVNPTYPSVTNARNLEENVVLRVRE